MSIQEELSQLRKELAPSGARLALVSKFQSNEKIMEIGFSSGCAFM